MAGKKIALFDMDNTLCDYSGQLRRDLELLRSPEEPAIGDFGNDNPEWLLNRMRLVKSQPGWWLELPELDSGVVLLKAAMKCGYSPHILTKGPHGNARAWEEKVLWCRQRLPREAGNVPVTITEDKSVVYGWVLFDDWPPYVKAWLEWRPRGFAIMPAQDYNEDFLHPRALRYDGLSETYDKVVAWLENPPAR